MSEASVDRANTMMREVREAMRKRRRLWSRKPREPLPDGATRWDTLISTVHSNGFSIEHCQELRRAIIDWHRRTNESHAAVRAVIAVLEEAAASLGRS